MKVMFIVYHDIKTEARSQEILECATKLGETILVSYSKPSKDINCKSIITGKGKRKYFTFIKESIKAIKRESPDIVILHDNYTALILRWLKKHRKNIYVIFDSSELYIDRKPRNFKTFISSHMSYFEKKYLKFADVVIAANIERANLMQKYYKLNEVPIVFDNIHRIDDNFDILECETKYSHLFKDDTFNIVYGGGIARQRLTFELAEAVGKLGNKYRLIIIGKSSKDDKELLNSMLKEKQYSNIFYVGFISRSELRYMFNKAHISVSIFAKDYLNNIYCASGKLYESLFEGTPILVSDNPPLKRICKDFKVGVSTNEFTKGIIELKKNYDYYCENVQTYTSRIDVKGRIDNLARALKKRIETDC